MLKLKKYPKRSPYYLIRGTVAGVTVFESTETTDRPTAERIKNRKENEILNRRKLGERPTARVGDAVIAYLDSGGEGRFLSKLNEHFKDRPLNDIGQQEIDQAARALYPNAKPATLMRQVYGPMIAILRHANNVGLEGAIYRTIKTPEIAKVPVIWATDDEVDPLLLACRPNLRAWILVSTYTGLRASEMIRQTRRDYFLRDGWVNINRTKNGEPAFVPINEECQEAVARIMPTADDVPVFGYHTVQGVNKALKAAAVKAGLTYYSTHKIGRHSFAARLFSDGHDIKMVKEAGRWKKLQVVDERYGHLEIKRVHDAMLIAGKRAKRVQLKAKSATGE